MSHSSNPVHEQLPSLRRNGQKPSCEPCRKSKYRCDHGQPTCRRCEVRGITQRCIYHPAPMKGLTAPRRKKGAANPLSPASTELQQTTKTSSQIPTPETPRDLPESMSVAQDHGFLGSTAYNAPFMENEDRIALDYDSGSEAPDFGEKLHQQITAKQRGIHHMDHRMKEAIRVFKFLHNLPDLERMMEYWDDKKIECGLMSFWIDSMWATVREDIWNSGSLSNEKSMTDTIHRLFQNTSRPIVVKPHMKVDDFIEQFSGKNVRWEALAVVFLACGLCVGDIYCDSGSLKFVGNTESGRQSLHYNLFEMANICVTFCDELGCINDIYLVTLIENGVLSSQVLGDGHHIVWRKIGDMSTAIFASGYHQENKAGSLPFWLLETRRRCLGVAYALDKSLCMFLGRPPRILRRYCKIEVPLDLANQELLLEGDALQDVLNNLRPDGWSNRTHDGSESVNWTRPFVINGLLREELLEICLGPPPDDLRQKAHDLIRRNAEQHVMMPHSINIPPSQWVSSEVVPSWYSVNMWLEFKYNEFLIRRTLVRQLKDRPDELLQLAHTLLTAVIEVRNIRGIAPSRLACMQWVAVLFGLPPAGVLALELMQLNSKDLCHSKVAQDLCIFISYLRWVHVPGDGNYQIVERARRTLQRILDRFMEKPRNRSEPQADRADNHQLLTPSTDSMLWSDTTAINDFSWLDADQWDPGMWPNINLMGLPSTAT